MSCYIFVIVATCCGSCMPNMSITKANAEKKQSGERCLPSHHESECETACPDLHM